MIDPGLFARYRDASKALLDGLDEIVAEAVSGSIEEVVLPDLDRRADQLWGDGFSSEVWTDGGELMVGWRERSDEAEAKEFGDLDSRPAPVLRMGTRAVRRDLSEAMAQRFGEALR